MPLRPVPILAVLLAVAGATACTRLPAAPDTEYRQALETALAEGRCEGPAVDRLWDAYHRWYAIASSLMAHHRGEEAVALLRQGDRFAALGCPAVARASYETLLQRFPGPAYAHERDGAALALRALPPPPPPPTAPGAVPGTLPGPPVSLGV